MRALLAALLFAFAAPIAAQESAQEGREVPALRDVMLIDSARLFRETRLGQRISAEIDAQAVALNEENDRIVRALTEEERSLTELRPDMEPEAFRAAAEEFDQRVQEIRRARDAAEAALRRDGRAAQIAFSEAILPVIDGLMRERGVVALIERNAAFLAFPQADLTDAAIARIDAELGDGAGLTLVPSGEVADEADMAEESTD